VTRRIVIPGDPLNEFDNAEDLKRLRDPKLTRALAGRVLFLDDSHTRWKTFRSLHPQADRVETAHAAVRALERSVVLVRPFHAVCLDHDLGGEHFVDSSRRDCGMEVVRYMVKMRPPVGHVIVHTNFAEAGKTMRHMLRAAGYDVVYWPFGWDWCR